MTKFTKAKYLTELPSAFSEQIAKDLSKCLSKEHKKRLGQFFTPIVIAKFMSGLFDIDLYKTKIRILDPGCGTLTLTCVLVERLIIQNKNIKEIEIDAYDTDTSLSETITSIVFMLKEWALNQHVNVKVNYFDSDFLLINKSVLKENTNSYKYDLIISNPPYFKIGKQDPRLECFDLKFQGQQNIYSLFLLGAANLLKKSGQLVFIVPRSFTSGLYFQSFRDSFLSKMMLNHFHLFYSRTDGFKKDQVQQENVILKATLKGHNHNNSVIISSSNGANDLILNKEKEFSIEHLVKSIGKLRVIHLPENSYQEQAMIVFSNWTHTLSSFGMKVSTGPVVPFRCRSYLRHLKPAKSNYVPMLWMHNCLKMELNWPSKKENKEAWIVENVQSNSKTIKNQNYILLRRFSSKEDRSKLVATPHLEENFSHSRLGIENHLNYLYKPNGSLEKNEVFGLAVLYNSSLFDSFIRSLNGNTQVSATELNGFPLPSIDQIKKIGEKYMSLNGQGIQEIDSIVNKTFNLP